MKKSVFTFLSALLLITACQHELEGPTLFNVPGNILSAQIEQDEATKTVLGENGNVLWSEEDQIVAFMKSSYGHKYQIKPSFVGKTYADFSRVLSDSGDDLFAGMEFDHNVAYYPYSESVECMKYDEAYSLNVELPFEQAYQKNSFGNGTFPMVAVSEDDNIIFKNVCGGILLQLKGTQEVKYITIQGKNNEKLSGAAVVTAYTDGTKPVIAMADDAFTAVTLNCGNGIQLNETTATEFIISLPPVVFSKGFKVILEDKFGNTGVVETDKSNTVYRSSLLAMPEIDVVMNTTIPNNQIWYRATEQIIITEDGFNTTVTSHEYNENTQKGIITFDGALTTIGDYAFSNYNPTFLTHINIPEGVTSIGEGAFAGCSFSTINIPMSVTSIGEWAFGDCKSLVEVRINGDLISYANILSGCPKLEKIYSSISTPDNRLMIHEGEIVAVACSGLTEVFVPEGVTSIGQYSFYRCSSLTGINIPEGVTSIGASAFSICSSLTSINIPEGITSIEKGTFESCYSLASINIPESVTSIGDYAFYSCSSLTSIKIPENVISIGKNAFYSCSSLTSIKIPEGVTSIEDYAFRYCSSLASIDLPESVTYIGISAFNMCELIASINIPKNVTEIGSSAFRNCKSLKTIYVEAVTPPIVSKNTFPGTLECIYVPIESISTYKDAEGWNYYADFIKGY